MPDHPTYRADHATSTEISPDGQTLLVLTSGYNRLDNAKGHRIDSASDEYVFVYDISQGMPRKTQVMKVANTFLGIAWNPKPKSRRPTLYPGSCRKGGENRARHCYIVIITTRASNKAPRGSPTSELNRPPLRFKSIAGQTVRGDFDGGALSSDGGPLLRRSVDQQIGLAAAIADQRHSSYVAHGVADLLAQRVYQVASAYEDGQSQHLAL